MSNDARRGWFHRKDGNESVDAAKQEPQEPIAVGESVTSESVVEVSPAEGAVTSMQAELGRALDLEEVKQVLAAEFWHEWKKFTEPAASAPTGPA
jgi:hypothetical protein